MFCVECGTESSRGKFCTNCGNLLEMSKDTDNKDHTSSKSAPTQFVKWNGKTSSITFVIEFVSDREFTTLQKFERENPGAIEDIFKLYNETRVLWEVDKLKFNFHQLLTIEAMISCVNSWYSKYEVFFAGLNPYSIRKEMLEEVKETDQNKFEQLSKAFDWWDDPENLYYLTADLLDRMKELLGEDSYLYKLIYKNYELACYEDLSEICLLILEYRNDESFHYNLRLQDVEGNLNLSEEEFNRTNNLLSAKVFIADFLYATYRFDGDQSTNC